MLIQRQLTNGILVDAQRLRKESLELRHNCRNTRAASVVLRYLAQREINRAHQVRGTTSHRKTIRVTPASVDQFNKQPG
jgi:hypothetical protein